MSEACALADREAAESRITAAAVIAIRPGVQDTNREDEEGWSGKTVLLRGASFWGPPRIVASPGLRAWSALASDHSATCRDREGIVSPGL
jgi:hypothetical protein